MCTGGGEVCAPPWWRPGPRGSGAEGRGGPEEDEEGEEEAPTPPHGLQRRRGAGLFGLLPPSGTAGGL